MKGRSHVNWSPGHLLKTCPQSKRVITCLLVDADTQRGLGHVEYDPGPAVVVLEGHTLVDGRVALDVDVVAALKKEDGRDGGGRASSGKRSSR